MRTTFSRPGMPVSGLPYSLRGAMYGNWTFPVDAEYEFRLRIANFRGDNGDLVNQTPEEKAKAAADAQAV